MCMWRLYIDLGCICEYAIFESEVKISLSMADFVIGVTGFPERVWLAKWLHFDPPLTTYVSGRVQSLWEHV